jgi:hypothetical protein
MRQKTVINEEKIFYKFEIPTLAFSLYWVSHGSWCPHHAEGLVDPNLTYKKP